MNFKTMKNPPHHYDLKERTALFGESIIHLCKRLPQDIISRPIIVQLIRAGTSIGANYREANGASSRKDFKNKIFICKKEVQETKHWLRMLTCYFPDQNDAIGKLAKECQELILIFGKIASSANKKI